jgi:hypothetical protein
MMPMAMVAREVDIAYPEPDPAYLEPPRKRGRPTKAVLEAKKSHINTTTTTPVRVYKRRKQL